MRINSGPNRAESSKRPALNNVGRAGGDYSESKEARGLRVRERPARTTLLSEYYRRFFRFLLSIGGTVMNRILRLALVSAAFAVLALALYSCSSLGLTGGSKGDSQIVGSGFSTDLIAGD